jgi:hypothetical protein
MNYEDSHKKSGFLTGVESRVTAMRGAAGWRRQLELASERVGRANLLALPLLLYHCYFTAANGCVTVLLYYARTRYFTAALVFCC